MLASIRRFAADVVKHAILGEAADPSGEVQNVSLGRVVGVSDDCLVVVGHLRFPHRDCLVMAASLCAFIVLLISVSPLVVDFLCGYALIILLFVHAADFSQTIHKNAKIG